MSGSAPVRLVAVVGGSASGKTWLADRLCDLLNGHAVRLSQDDFYRDWSHLPAAERAGLNFDHPDTLDWAELERVLRELRAERSVQAPLYDFHTHCRRAETRTVPSARLMIADGLWLLHRPEIRRLFDLAVFLDCPETDRLERRISRDIAERGRTREAVEQQFAAMVAPMHEQFVAPQAKWADVTLTYPYAPRDIRWLQGALADLLSETALPRAWSYDAFHSQLQSVLLPVPSLP